MNGKVEVIETVIVAETPGRCSLCERDLEHVSAIHDFTAYVGEQRQLVQLVAWNAGALSCRACMRELIGEISTEPRA